MEKYLKYKSKYLNLQKGGVSRTNVINMIDKNIEKIFKKLKQDIIIILSSNNLNLFYSSFYYKIQYDLNLDLNIIDYNEIKNNEIIKKELTNYFYNLIMKIDPHCLNFCNWIIESYINNKFDNFHFISNKLYYYLNILKIIIHEFNNNILIDENNNNISIDDKIKNNNQSIDKIKQKINNNLKIEERKKKIKKNKDNKIILNKLDNCLEDIYMRNNEYNKYKIENNNLGLIKNVKKFKDFNLFYFNLFNFNDNDFNDINIFNSSIDLKSIDRNIDINEANLISKKLSEYFNEIYMKIDKEINEKLLSLTIDINFKNNIIEIFKKFNNITKNCSRIKYLINPFKGIYNILNNNKFYLDNNVLVVNPKDKISSIFYGIGTKWCTSSFNNNKFKDYNRNGNLFILIDLLGFNNKYQVHIDDITDDKNISKDIYDIFYLYPNLFKITNNDDNKYLNKIEFNYDNKIKGYIIKNNIDYDNISDLDFKNILLLITKYNNHNKFIYNKIKDKIKNITDLSDIIIKEAFYYACKNNFIEIVKLLLLKGMDVNYYIEGYTPFLISCKKNNEEIINLLLEYNVNINLSTHYYYITPFMYACKNNNINLVKNLLCKKININLIDNDKENAFTYACENDNVELISLLINRGIDINIINKNDDKIAFSTVCYYNNIKVAKFLLDKIIINNNYNIKNIFNEILLNACKNSFNEIIKLLLGNIKFLNILDLNYIDSKKKTALIYSCENNNSEIINLLLLFNKNKYNINIQDWMSMTALSYSIINKNIEIVELLLYKYGAELDFKTKHKIKNARELVNDSNNCELIELIHKYELIKNK